MTDSEDFATLFAAQGNIKNINLHVGERVTVSVIHIAKEDVFVSVSPTQEGSIAKAEVLDKNGELQISVGDSLDVFVESTHGGIVLTQKMAKGGVDVQLLNQARESGMPLEGTVTGLNKGGLEIDLGGARAFCPIGQADIHFVETPEDFMGKTLQFLVREIKENGRNVVLSRRALLERERAEGAKKLEAELQVGQQREGVVSRIADFGVFVDLGGLDGLIPMSELGYARVNNARDVVEEGQDVVVSVMRIEPDPKRKGQLRIALSLKDTLPDPWDTHAASLQQGSVVEGRVAKLEAFGAFIEFADGISGLAHISELADRHIRHPSEVLEVGQAVSATVLKIDAGTRRIGLSLKGAPTAPSGSASVKNTLSAGAMVDGIVERVERYGVFVKLSSGETALMPAAESETPRGADMGRSFPVGTELALAVLSIDERGRIKVSKKARQEAEERAVVESYGRDQSSNQSFGTLGDLLRKSQTK